MPRTVLEREELEPCLEFCVWAGWVISINQCWSMWIHWTIPKVNASMTTLLCYRVDQPITTWSHPELLAVWNEFLHVAMYKFISFSKNELKAFKVLLLLFVCLFLIKGFWISNFFYRNQQAMFFPLTKSANPFSCWRNNKYLF